MTTKTVTLEDGPSGCELRPILGNGAPLDRAVILRGTYGARADVVAKTAGGTSMSLPGTAF